MKKIVCGLIFLATLWLSKAVESTEHDEKKFRLPENVTPIKYDLVITTDLLHFKPQYEGEVRILIECKRPTKKIAVNSKALNIHEDDVKVYSVIDGQKTDLELKIFDRFYEFDKEQFIILLHENLTDRKLYEVFLSFDKKFSRRSKGYITQTYQIDEEGDDKIIAITHFGAINARAAFPCMDQIDMKAKFKISLIHHEKFKGISNMEKEDRQAYSEKEYWVKEEFKESEPMSTFFVAIALVDFTFLKLNTISPDIAIRFWADEADIDHIQFAGSLATHAFNFYSEFFHVPYAIEKLDLMVLPKNNVANEEKYGLITLGDFSVLSISETSDEEIKLDLALDTCHLICQQWIGTYVTMSWWNEYWFHEALILYLEIPCAEKISSKWKVTFFEPRTIASFIHVLSWDAEMKSPIMHEPPDEFDLTRRFIGMKSMGKAFHLMKMIKFFLGDEVFQASLKIYLDRFKFQNSTLNQVWEVFTEIATQAGILPAGYDMKEIMNTWITKRGYPEINVQRAANGNSITLKQERFVLSEDEKESEHDDVCWIAPLNFITRFKPQSEKVDLPIKDWMKCGKSSNVINVTLEDSEWILFDPDLNVLSRFNYDHKNWRLLQESLLDKNEYQKINLSSRARLISDMFELSNTGRLDYEIVFRTMKYLSHEEFHYPWKEAVEKLNHIRTRLFGTTWLKPFMKYVRNILESTFKKPEFQKIDDTPSNDHLMLTHKNTVITYSCMFGVEDCRERAREVVEKLETREQFENFLLTHSRIREVVLCEGIRYADEKRWNFLLRYISPDNDSRLNTEIISALGCTSQRTILEKYLNWSINNDNVLYGAESVMVFKIVAANEIGYDLIKNFFLKRIGEIDDYFMEDPPLLDYFEILLNATNKLEDLNEIQRFRISEKNYLDGLEEDIEKSVRKAKRNVSWLQRNEQLFSTLFPNGVAELRL